MPGNVTRRGFLAASAAGAAVLEAVEKPVVLGGKPVHTGRWPPWPVYEKNEEDALAGTLHRGHWYRGTGKKVAEFEEAHAAAIAAKA